MKIDRWIASSKTCSCYARVKVDLALKERRWTGEGCSTEHDRDVNAAENIRRIGIMDLGRAVGMSLFRSLRKTVHVTAAADEAESLAA